MSYASIPETVRAHAAATVAAARRVRIDDDALARLAAGGLTVPKPSLDPRTRHLDGTPEDAARAMLILDTINFGSGWFPTLRKRVGDDGRPVSGYTTVARSLADHFRAHGPWTNEHLRVMRTETIAQTLGQRADHELMALYAQALRQLSAFLGDRSVLDLVVGARGSAATFAASLADGMTMFRDIGFFKRAQIAAWDLSLAGIGPWHDLDKLTVFADNLVPHVLRCAGVLVYDDTLAAAIDAGTLLPAGGAEREIRAAAVVACGQLAPALGVSEAVLDAALWNLGQAPEFKARPRHRCRCVFY